MLLPWNVLTTILLPALSVVALELFANPPLSGGGEDVPPLERLQLLLLPLLFVLFFARVSSRARFKSICGLASKHFAQSGTATRTYMEHGTRNMRNITIKKGLAWSRLKDKYSKAYIDWLKRDNHTGHS